MMITHSSRHSLEFPISLSREAPWDQLNNSPGIHDGQYQHVPTLLPVVIAFPVVNIEIQERSTSPIIVPCIRFVGSRVATLAVYP
jgi:hypothetical protein